MAPTDISDPNGAEAGDIFLAENKTKDGVITLPSGLQYKVLEEGAGMEHPKVGTPCDCHYAGRLLDGTEFDSSYKRGNPSTFAPNQVIKGWTEAMQLMVVGDKWEMYIPWNLAYGAMGKPPKIPAKACLIFVMEIMKIKTGDTVPKAITFPEWGADDLALWTEKDEKALTSWSEGKVAKWEGGDAKLKEAYPTREALDAWIAKQCKGSKDKSLWKRTRTAKKKANAPAAAPKAPELNAKTARQLLDKALAVFKEPENKASLTALVKQADEQAGAGMASGQKAEHNGGNMARMMLLLPAVQQMLAPVMKEYGFQADDLMTIAAQLQGFGMEDPTITADTMKLMKAAQGDVSEL